MTDLSVRDVRPYLRGACRVTGPIDATINLTLNAGIAAYFLARSGACPRFTVSSGRWLLVCWAVPCSRDIARVRCG